MNITRSLLGLAALSTAIGVSPIQGAFAEDNARAALLDRYVAAFNAHDPAAFEPVIAKDYVQHNGRAGQGLAGFEGTVRQYFSTFPDFHVQLEDHMVSGDKVVARFTFTATHTQPVQLGPGAPVFPPTGNKLAWGGISIWRVADGKFVEHWDEDDLLGLARQMRGN